MLSLYVLNILVVCRLFVCEFSIRFTPDLIQNSKISDFFASLYNIKILLHLFDFVLRTPDADHGTVLQNTRKAQALLVNVLSSDRLFIKPSADDLRHIRCGNYQNHVSFYLKSYYVMHFQF